MTQACRVLGPGGALCALGTGADELGLMLDRREAVLLADLPAPGVERTVVKFDDCPAAATDQVVVMAPAASAVCRLATDAPDRIDLAVGGEPVEVAVDRREADPIESLVQLLGR